MKFVVTGINGQVACALKALEQSEHQIIALGRPNLDLARPSTVFSAIREAKPDAVISSAAYTAVDKAESEPDAAFAVNRDGAQAVALVASELGVPVIHLSTDYVYDGKKLTPYVETDHTGPTSTYGISKLQGEQAVIAANPNHAILRTAWVYSPYSSNFVKTMLRLAETRDEVKVVADQIGCPTSANDIAAMVSTIAKELSSNHDPELRGVFHVAGSGEATWADFARYVFLVYEEITGRRIRVHNISTAEYPTPVHRPANSRLDCHKLEQTFGRRLPHWQQSVRAVVSTLLSEGTHA
ncbi:dTDP-4-dehydrorhamnose reductase [Rhizobium sp. AC44/96]|uniref:dTDP-4-dehydrorhamnose reductase n=1 Tax=Rhizobium sp. AC44/96 TaxID=1841654 RepID=UPI00080F89E1|nr:dTDP-4-dehydrorhamnose reductase [Rhizobium sp. AC44/96]OCJ10227.1 dTDP-4-dehydrorhamnose reductase [Rhizobium sp. AC44/96]